MKIKQWISLVVAITMSALLLTGCGTFDPSRRFVTKGRELLEKEKYASAVSELKQAVEKNPNNEEAWMLLADAYLESGKRKTMEATLDEAVESCAQSEQIANRWEDVQKGIFRTSDGVMYHEEFLVSDNGQCMLVSAEYEQGLLSKIEIKNPTDDTVGTCYTYEYDAQGNLVEEKRGHPSQNSDELHWASRNTFEYDSQGNRVGKKYYGEDGTLSKSFSYEYDAQGQMVQETIWDAQGELCVQRTMEYDAQGHEVKKQEMEGGLVWTYDYDEAGLLVKEEFCVDASVRQYKIYEYDAGKQIRRTSYGNETDTPAFNEIWKYNNGKATEYCSNNETGTFCRRITCEYDAQGRETKWLRDDDPDQKQVQSLIYDSNDDLIGIVLESGSDDYITAALENASGESLYKERYFADGKHYIHDEFISEDPYGITWNADGKRRSAIFMEYPHVWW